MITIHQFIQNLHVPKIERSQVHMYHQRPCIDMIIINGSLVSLNSSKAKIKCLYENEHTCKYNCELSGKLVQCFTL